MGVEGLRGCWEGGCAGSRRKSLSPQTLLGVTSTRGYRGGVRDSSIWGSRGCDSGFGSGVVGWREMIGLGEWENAQACG